MFKKPYNYAISYTRPLLTGKLLYNNKQIVNEISTLIVVNEYGDILTTAYNAEKINLALKIKKVFNPILKEINAEEKNRKIKALEKKYGIYNETIIDLANIIIDVFKKTPKLKIIKHPYLDLAIIKTIDNKDCLIKNYPVFSNSSPIIGDELYSIGFAFPEFSAFDISKNSIKIDKKIIRHPFYPNKGMIKRHLADTTKKITMFESDLGFIKGLQGSPILNSDGTITGILVGTRNIKYLDFNLKENYHQLSYSINSSEMTDFLDKHSIKYYKGL